MIFSKLWGALTGESSQPATMLGQELDRYNSVMQNMASDLGIRLRTSRDYVSFGDTMLSSVQQVLNLGDAALGGAEQGLMWCLCAAGVAYCKGGEYYKAIDCWKILSENSADDASRAAAYLLGRMYFDGEVIPQDTQEAMKCWIHAAVGGYLDAQLWLGLDLAALYLYPEAGYWLSVAAERGHPQAKRELAALPQLVREHPDLYTMNEVNAKIAEGRRDARNWPNA